MRIIVRDGVRAVRHRAVAAEAGVPLAPGSGLLDDAAHAKREAARIGYPVMLKATNGGGGRGIRRCNSEEELLKNYDRVVSEASKAFGKPEVFLEKCVVNPRHIEVQVMGRQLRQRDPSVRTRLLDSAP